VPVLNKFLDVVQGTFETASNATVRSPSTILLHFYLHSISHLAHFTIVEELLSEYSWNNKQLSSLSIPCNFGRSDLQLDWDSDATKLLAGRSQFDHVVVFITTHSDPVSGDLWLGEDETGKVWAAQASAVSSALVYHSSNINYETQQWLDLVLGPFKPLLSSSNLMVFLLVCGSIVKNPDTFASVKQSLARCISHFCYTYT